MSQDIGPGDWVVCVDAGPIYWPDGVITPRNALLTEGGEYRVEHVHTLDIDQAPSLVGVDDGNRPFWIGRFRKIDRISDAFRRALLTKVPLDVDPITTPAAEMHEG